MKQQDAFEYLFAEHSSLLAAHRTLLESVDAEMARHKAQSVDHHLHVQELVHLRGALAEHCYAIRNHRFALQLVREGRLRFDA